MQAIDLTKKLMSHDSNRRKPVFRISMNWLGLVPFAIFSLLFLLLPTFNIVLGAFRTQQGAATLDNVMNLAQPRIAIAFWVSIKLSFASALIGCLLGFILATTVALGGLPRWLRQSTLTFSGVASNFAGVPLSFAFIATLGRVGILTIVIREVFGINLYGLGFNLLSFWIN